MRKFLAVTALAAISVPCFGQLADMIDLPEDMVGKEPEYSEEDLLRSWGWLLAERFNLKGLELSPQEIEWVAEGLISHVDGEDAPTDLSKSQLALQEYFANREAEIMSRQFEQNRREGEEFFDSLFGTPGMLSLGTGLFYEIKEKGNDKRPGPSDGVLVRYEGRFLDNTVFDSTEEKGPIAFNLDEVIPAWSQGMPLIGEGGRIKLYVPSDLGYGDEGRPGIPPASTLVFDVELLKVIRAGERLTETGEVVPANPPVPPVAE
ncbi:FKBP-type peptidyl-prolyl cis-trans isomerase [Pelagicoccus albus]|uniref:Peptidyl-prolyl cis-trans isomerase n=1 Tax=Pelagicoccus albus TaxID=415222 RepID=A0A7X1EBF2_9BACT|nr:FKBP-type peptidyl-prolyl cis-trans isomerase [Pelagicoccus albus]MBC2607747.1 FKBP-type peptidyl-prolyl cis-trans isomerase [Pelagicoccus albus]